MELTKLAVAPAVQTGGTCFTPEQLALLGAVSGAEASIEMTPFQQLYIEVPTDQQAEIGEMLRAVGLDVLLPGFVAKFMTCNFCRGSEEAGLAAAQELNRAVAGLPTPTPMRIGFAGCALGTSEPLLKEIGIVKMRDVFDIYVGGDPKGIKPAFAQLLVSGVAAEQLVRTVTTIVDYYIQHAKGKEKFKKFVDRISMTKLQELIEAAAG